MLFIFGRPYRKSMGQRRDMPLHDGKVPGGYGAFGIGSGAVETAGPFGGAPGPIGRGGRKGGPLPGGPTPPNRTSWGFIDRVLETNPSPQPTKARLCSPDEPGK